MGDLFPSKKLISGLFLAGGIILCSSLVLGLSMFEPTSSDQNIRLTLKDVLKHPERYNGKRVTIDCYYFEGFETVVLASNVIVHESGYRQVIDGVVWAIWEMRRPKEMLEIMLKKIPGIVDRILYGRVEVDGVFITMKGLGHLGEYNYGFEITGISIYDDVSGRFICE